MNSLAESPPAACRPLQVLVVDDDAFVRKVLSHQLRKLGAGRIIEADDGERARELLRSNGEDLDLIVCDLVMPGADGVELLQDIAAHHTATALILMSSAEARLLRSVEYIARSRELRVLGCLQKPIQTPALKVLLSRMSGCVAHRRAAPGLGVEVTPAMLQAALAAHQIRIAVQPQINLLTGQIEAAEALARWTLPDGAAITPDQFLPVAEASGLLDQLTDQVFELAVRAARDWHSAGLGLRVAINVAPTTLSRPGLPDRIARLTAQSRLSLRDVVIEVTETGVARDLLVPLEVLSRFRLQGMELSIDDFGTGYSSLERLRHIPFTELKIDRSFVSVARSDQDARRIVESSIRLAHDLGLRTVAEGIETLADEMLMRALGCDLGQGFLYARPMPPSQLPAWVASR
jgi:EAL domain-containing protein (putative c-di-GMP-specific phosphodiesterase class I)/AmiR/NasT family two-component response regulator